MIPFLLVASLTLLLILGFLFFVHLRTSKRSLRRYGTLIQGFEQVAEGQGREFAKLKRENQELRTFVSGTKNMDEDLLEERRREGLRKKFIIDLARELKKALKQDQAPWRLQPLVDDILKLSEIEGGVLEVHPYSVSLEAMVTEVRKFFDSTLNKKRIRLEQSLPKDLYVFVDPEVFQYLLRCLVSHAIERMSEGGELRLSAHSQDGFCKMSIEDTGQTVDAEKLPGLFESFYESKVGLENSLDKSGLGLVLVKRLVMATGGEVAVSSLQDKGLSCAFTIPLAQDSTH